MNLRVVALLILIPFAALTAVAIVSDGSNGFAEAIGHNLLTLQIWVDLVIAMIFWCAWVLKDAKDHGRTPWPWIVAALLVGAFAPLIYMIRYQRWPASPAAAHDSGATAPLGWIVLMLVVLGALTIAALAIDGTDVPGAITHSWSNVQIWVDLVIVIFLWLVWMVNDARASGRSPWGWLILALLIGSFSPLIYALVYRRWPASHPPAGAASSVA